MRFNDEEEVRRQVAARRAQEQQERLQQAYDELVHTDKAADMREQQLLRAEMALAYRTGDHAKAERLALRLAPDEVWGVWNGCCCYCIVSHTIVVVVVCYMGIECVCGGNVWCVCSCL